MNVTDIADVSADVPLSSGYPEVVAVWIPKDQTITGVKWWQKRQGDYTANNYNGVALYSYSGGTLTKVASSTDDGNIWKGGTNTWQSKAFSSTYSATAGLYYIVSFYQKLFQVFF